MNPSTVARYLVPALVILWLWPTAAHAQEPTTTLHGTGLQPLVEESGSSQTLNIYGPGGVIIAQVATESPTGGTPTTQTRYLLHDHLGSTRVVLDSNNKVLGSFDYAPFGETTAMGNVADVAYRYTGQEVNGALGTVNYHARQYDAGLGRFLRVDPARYNASAYVYTNDNPVNFVDRTGRQPVLWLVARDILFNDTGYQELSDLLKLAKSKTNILFSPLEARGLDKPMPEGNFSLVIDAHSSLREIQILPDSLVHTELTPEGFAEFVYERLRAENLPPESLTSIYLQTCRSGCERHGISAAERFFQHGLARLPKLERVIASPYQSTVQTRAGQVQLGFYSPIEGQPGQGIVLDASYDPQQFFEQNIVEAVLHANIQGLWYSTVTSDGVLTRTEPVPDESRARILHEHFSEPLIRTYTRAQVEQRIGQHASPERPLLSEAARP